jgi:hypothetical protein
MLRACWSAVVVPATRTMSFAISRFLHPLRGINLNFLNMQTCHLTFTLTFYTEILQYFCIYKFQHA